MGEYRKIFGSRYKIQQIKNMLKKAKENEMTSLFLKAIILNPSFVNTRNLNDFLQMKWFKQAVVQNFSNKSRSYAYEAFVYACKIYELKLFDLSVSII